jgi:hypothetical protein
MHKPSPPLTARRLSASWRAPGTSVAPNRLLVDFFGPPRDGARRGILLLLFMSSLLGCGGGSADPGQDAQPRDAAEMPDAGETDADAGSEQGEGADASDAESPDSEDGSDPTPSTPEEALEDAIRALCPDYAERWCAAAAACDCDAAPGFPEDCAASFEGACAAQLTGFLPAVRGGEAVFRPIAAAECLEAFGEVFAACVPMGADLFFVVCPIISPAAGWSGLPRLGEACSGQCAAGLRCGSAGACVEPGTNGMDCGASVDCAPTLLCVDGKCRPPNHVASGEPCSAPGTCTGDLECLASSRKICEAAVSGGPCTYSEDCPTGEYCVLSPEGTGVCTTLPAQSQPCGDGVLCAEGLACADTGTCEALPSAGSPCGLGRFGPLLCGAGLACNNGVCGAVPGLGEPCAMGVPACAAGLGCAFETEGSFCREPVGDGGPCQNDAACASGHFCNFAENLCRPVRAVGEPCKDGNECGPAGACLPDEVFSFRCAPVPGVGDACFLDECAGDAKCRSPYAEGACVPALCGMMSF